MKINSPQKSFVILVLVTLILWGGLIYGAYRFLVQKIVVVSESVMQKSRELNDLDYNTRHLGFFQADYQKVESDAVLLERLILHEDEAIQFIENLEEIAIRYQVKQEISLREEVVSPKKRSSDSDEPKESAVELGAKDASSKKGATKIVFNIRSTAAFPDLVKYIQALEALENYPNIINASISIDDKNKVVEADLEVELTIKSNAPK